MSTIEVKPMARDDIDAVGGLLQAAARADGHAPVGERQWLDLVEGQSDTVVGLLARPTPDADPAGYAQLNREPDHWSLAVVVDPSHRDPTRHMTTRLLRAAIDVVADRGGGKVEYWAVKPDAADDDAASQAGFAPVRDVRQLRRSLPMRRNTEPLDVRPFRPGLDEDAWLAVNNRVFAGHPDQGNWTLDMLVARERQTWFDPGGFLLHEHGGRLAGFCWTKVHRDKEPPAGEIYVLGIDPDFQGTGLGERLAIAGLEHLAAQDLTVATLYVDATNHPALKLYSKLGFDLDHVDRAYETDVAPRQTPPTPTSEPSP